MSLSDLSIRRPVFAWMLTIAMIGSGFLAVQKMGVAQYPDVDFPVISINVGYPGATAELLESEVVAVIEEGLSTIEGVKHLSSLSKYGAATISVEFELSQNIDTAIQEVQSRFARIQARLPKDLPAPTITKSNPDDDPIMFLALTSETRSHRELVEIVRSRIRDQLSKVIGVGDISFTGYVDPNLRVWVSNERLRNFNLSFEDVLNAVQSEYYEVPNGSWNDENREWQVRTLGKPKKASEFGIISIIDRGSKPNYVPLRIADVAKIEEGLAKTSQIFRLNGKSGIGIGVRKQKGANAVEVASRVRAKISDFKRELPPDIQLTVNHDLSTSVQESVSELKFTLILSALLTALVCWIFLGSWSSTWNVILAIPTSIIGSFAVLELAGFTLNTFTLMGLTLAMGIVVDDAIMVLENITRYQESGSAPRDAALEGTREISGAATAATISILAVFLPILFVDGAIGKFLNQFGITVGAAVVLSLIEALTLTPMRCASADLVGAPGRFRGAVDRQFSYVISLYARLLRVALRNRTAVVISFLAIFGLSLWFLKGRLKYEFVPAQDMSLFFISVETPLNSSLSFTREKVIEIENHLSLRREIANYSLSIGPESNRAGIAVSLIPASTGLWGRSRKSHLEIMDELRSELSGIKDAKTFLRDPSKGGFGRGSVFPVQFLLVGSDLETMDELAREMLSRFKSGQALSDANANVAFGNREIRIVPDREMAQRKGVSIKAISDTLTGIFDGLVVGHFTTDGRQEDIRVQLDAPGAPEKMIGEVLIRNNRGELVRLADLVTVESGLSVQQVFRFDGRRAIRISANYRAGVSQSVAEEEIRKVAKEILPPGYSVEMTGSSGTFQSSAEDILTTLLLGIAIAYMVLASQFNSFKSPVAILVILPFGIAGALFGLNYLDLSVNIYSSIGIIFLMGIAKKNSILLVEFSDQLRSRAQISCDEALIQACPKRLRPIIMTSVATLAGALPAALAIGPGAEVRIPMSIAIIGGVLVSTPVTLFFVPCFHSIVSRFKAPIRFPAPVRTSNANVYSYEDAEPRVDVRSKAS